MANERPRGHVGPQLKINAGDLCKHMVNSQIIDNFVSEILGRFENEILTASKEGNTSVNVDVPVNFAAGGISNKNAQIIIYYRLINELEEKDFDVKIQTFSGQRCTFQIKWANDWSDATMEHMMGIVGLHIRGDAVAKKNTPAPRRRRPV